MFQKMKTQCTRDFDFTVPGSKRLQNVIQKLKKWIKVLEAKTKVVISVCALLCCAGESVLCWETASERTIQIQLFHIVFLSAIASILNRVHH